MARFGFYEYDKATVGSDGVIFKHPLTSKPDEATEVGAGPWTYTSAGFAGVPTAGLTFAGLTDQADLAIEGTLQFMISNDAFNAGYTPAAAENFISFVGGTRFDMQKNQTFGHVKMICSGTMNGKYTGIDELCYGSPNGRETNSDGLVECVMSWDQCGMKLWIDKHKLFDVPWNNSSTMPNFATIAINTAAASGGTYTYKNLLISTKKTVIKPSSHKVRVLNVYGDSFPQLGNYPQFSGTNQQRSYYFSSSDNASPGTVLTLDGQNGTGYDNGSGHYDDGMIPTTHRWLAKNGLFTNKIEFWGEGGSGYETAGAGLGQTVPQRVATSLDGNYPVPDVAVLVAGYNDASGGGITGGFQTAVETSIASLKTANSNIKIIITTTPVNTHADFLSGEPDPIGQVQAINAVIEAVAAADSSVTLVDIYTLFGGAANDGTSNMSGDYKHPNAAGQAIYGRNIANAIVSVV